MSDVLMALADGPCLDIARALVRGTQTTEALCCATGLSELDVARNLVMLRKAGIVRRQWCGADVVYGFQHPRFKELTATISNF